MPEPLALLLEVTQVQPLVLAPVAGALPLGGFSGGGFVDADGNVIGVLTAVRHSWEPGGATETCRVFGCSVATIADANRVRRLPAAAGARCCRHDRSRPALPVLRRDDGAVLDVPRHR